MCGPKHSEDVVDHGGTEEADGGHYTVEGLWTNKDLERILDIMEDRVRREPRTSLGSEMDTIRRLVEELKLWKQRAHRNDEKLQCFESWALMDRIKALEARVDSTQTDLADIQTEDLRGIEALTARVEELEASLGRVSKGALEIDKKAMRRLDELEKQVKSLSEADLEDRIDHLESQAGEDHTSEMGGYDPVVVTKCIDAHSTRLEALEERLDATRPPADINAGVVGANRDVIQLQGEVAYLKRLVTGGAKDAVSIDERMAVTTRRLDYIQREHEKLENEVAGLAARSERGERSAEMPMPKEDQQENPNIAETPTARFEMETATAALESATKSMLEVVDTVAERAVEKMRSETQSNGNQAADVAVPRAPGDSDKLIEADNAQELIVAGQEIERLHNRIEEVEAWYAQESQRGHALRDRVNALHVRQAETIRLMQGSEWALALATLLSPIRGMPHVTKDAVLVAHKKIKKLEAQIEYALVLLNKIPAAWHDERLMKVREALGSEKYADSVVEEDDS